MKSPASGLSLPHLLPALALALLALAADLATKHVFWPGDAFDVIPGFFSIAPRENTGGVFGLGAGHAWANRLFILVSCAAVLFIGWLFATSSKRLGLPFALAVGLVLGGAVGNLVDRIHYGFVRDFLDFSIGRHTWPTFNVADSAICVGTFLLACRLWTTPAGHR